MDLTIFENGLITVYETNIGEKLVIGRELHEGLCIRTDFSTWMKRRIEECGFYENDDFIRLPKNGESNSVNKIEYYLILDAAKEMAMLERNDIGKKYRRYLIEVEKKAKEHQANLNQLSPGLKVLINMEMSQKKMKKEIQETRKESKEIKEELKEIKEVIIIDPKEQWRCETNKIIGKIGNSISDYKTPRDKIYRALEERAKCKLNIRLDNLKGRALRSGMSKSQTDKMNYLDVINNDHKLKEIYIAIVKEFAIKYRV